MYTRYKSKWNVYNNNNYENNSQINNLNKMMKFTTAASALALSAFAAQGYDNYTVCGFGRHCDSI